MISPRSAAPAASVKSVSGRTVGENRRIDSAEPFTATGATTAHTRAPSARRASTIGVVRSTRRPIGARIRSITCSTVVPVSRPFASRRPCRSIHIASPLTSTSSMSGSDTSVSRTPRPAIRGVRRVAQDSTFVAGCERSDPADRAVDQLGQVARAIVDRATHRIDEIGGVGHAATRARDLWRERGRRPPSSRPASIERLTRGSQSTVATIGARVDVSMSRRPSGWPGSSTNTTPVGCPGMRPARRSAR